MTKPRSSLILRNPNDYVRLTNYGRTRCGGVTKTQPTISWCRDSVRQTRWAPNEGTHQHQPRLGVRGYGCRLANAELSHMGCDSSMAVMRGQEMTSRWFMPCYEGFTTPQHCWRWCMINFTTVLFHHHDFITGLLRHCYFIREYHRFFICEGSHSVLAGVWEFRDSSRAGSCGCACSIFASNHVAFFISLMSRV